MAKKQVSRLTFYSLHIAYHCLCLSGLIWHITHISTNFFAFDVIRDINVTMPEEINDVDHVLNVCFDNEDILHIDEYKKIVNEQKPTRIPRAAVTKRLRRKKIEMTPIGHRFNFTLPYKFLFRGHHNTVEEFIIGSSFCYQFIHPTVLFSLKSNLSDVTTIGISRGELLPLFDHRRIFKVDGVSLTIKKENESHRLEIMSFKYMIEKAKWPYTERCKDYTTPEFKNRLQAVSNCASRMSLNESGFLFKEKILRTRSKYLNYSIGSSKNYTKYEEICEKENPSPDCLQNVHLTVVSPFKLVPEQIMVLRKLHYVIGHNSYPSFFIKSKPRIDDIDYITYILGSLGAWLGFSFIAINPIPYFLRKNDNKMDILSKSNTSDKLIHSNVNQLKKKFLIHDQLIKSISTIQIRKINDAIRSMDNSIKDINIRNIDMQRNVDMMFQNILREVKDIKTFIQYSKS